MLSKFVLFFSLAFAFAFHGNLASAADALDEVNQYRVARGLVPFFRDEALSQAAEACATHRATNGIAGHSNDFRFLPQGAQAQAAGCAAWPVGMGWGSCCTTDNWRYGGAAYVIGRDGKRYMQLFVSNSPNALQPKAAAKPAPVQNAQPPVAQASATPQYTWLRVETGWLYRKDGVQVGFLRDDYIFHWLRADGTFSEGQPYLRK